MFDKLKKLQEKGYIPDIIFDIGAHHGDWTREMLNIYSEIKYILIEPIEYSELNQLIGHPNITIFNYILNDKSEEVKWYELKSTGDSMFKEKSNVYNGCNSIVKNSITLNELLKTEEGILDNCKNIFIKIDCQGAEIPILKGSSDILEITDFILLELPLFGQYNENVPDFLEHIQFMKNIGFLPYDIVDNHYINEFNMQIDMLFINKNHEFNKIVQKKLLC